MQFGKRKADAPPRGTGNYLRRFPKGETKVRFIDEPDDWIEYWEHFTPDRKGFPCTEERDTCPGCTSSNEAVRKASRKYAANVHLVKTGQVLPHIIPVSLADRFSTRAERNDGTLLTRDYVVIRSGDGFDTEYDVDQEDKYEVDFKALRAKAEIDIQDCFREAFIDVWGDLNKTGSPSDIPDEHTPGDADPPTEPAGQSASAADQGDVVLGEKQIRAMDKAQLRSVCDTAGLSYDPEDTASELVDKLLAAFGEE